MNIVCIGGGHGLSKVLKSLKNTSIDLTAIVATTDNGGSTGRIRQDKNEIALGDIRRCISSLSNKNDFIPDLVEQRFNSKNELGGHCLGNIVLSSLCQYVNSPTKAIELYSKILEVKEKIYPMSDQPTDLIATCYNGKTIFGECNIDKLKKFPKSISLTHDVLANKEVEEAIIKADIILLGPGSLLTSVIPVLLVKNIKEAIIKTKATRIFIENVAKENSVVDKIPSKDLMKKTLEILGYKFFDISLSPLAIKELTFNKNFSTNSKESKYHNEKELKYIIQEFSNQHHLEINNYNRH